MKRIHLLANCGVFAIALTLAAPASAQIAVFDPSNYSQNLMTAANTLKQIDNQLTALQNQSQMLLNQARHLTSLPTSGPSRKRRTCSSKSTRSPTTSRRSSRRSRSTRTSASRNPISN
jgi:P-type conjugative transfer protein TrbJ